MPEFYSTDDNPPTNRFARILWDAEKERQARRLQTSEAREKLNRQRVLYKRPSNDDDDQPIEPKRLEYIRQLVKDALY
jgi:hypothetical protein